MRQRPDGALPSRPSPPPHEGVPALRIAMICAHSNPLGPLGRRDTGGMSVYIREISRALAAQGHRVDLFVGAPSRDSAFQGLSQGEETLEAYFGPNVHWVSVPCTVVAPHDPEEQRKTAEAFRHAVLKACRERPSVRGARNRLVFSHYWLSGLAGVSTAHALGVPHVVMFHTLALSKTAALGRSVDSSCRLCAERLVAGRSQAILAPTETEKIALITHYDVPPERIAVVPCGVDLHLFRPSHRLSARRRLGLPPEAAVFLFVGRLDPIKGLERLLKAFSALSASVPTRLLVVGGDVSEEARLGAFREAVETLGISDRVIFAGRVEQPRLPDYYAAADALTVASHYESFCLVALEALASGRPVVGPPVGALPELLDVPEAGVPLKDNSPEELLRGMATVMDRRDTESASREALRRRIARRYAWDRVARDLAGRLASIMDRNTVQREPGGTSAHGSGVCSDYCRTSGRS